MSNDTSITQDEPNQIVNLARQYLYRFFALALSDPRSKRWLDLLDVSLLDAAALAAELLREDTSVAVTELAPGELPGAMLDIAAIRSWMPRSVEDAIPQYQQVFGLMAPTSCPPYETEYCSHRDAFYRAHQMADVSGFYRAFGLRPSRDVPERHDHVALELEFMAWLIAREQQALAEGLAEHAQTCAEAQKKFLQDHLSWWLPTFAFAVRREAEGVNSVEELSAQQRSFYGAVAAALAAFVAVERSIMQIAPPRELMSPNSFTPEAADACAACCGLRAANSQ